MPEFSRPVSSLSKDRGTTDWTLHRLQLFCPTTPVGDLLSLAPDPPAPEMIRKAIADLQAMGIMDAEEELTELGHCLVHFGMAPQLAKALVYAAFFG